MTTRKQNGLFIYDMFARSTRYGCASLDDHLCTIYNIFTRIFVGRPAPDKIYLSLRGCLYIRYGIEFVFAALALLTLLISMRCPRLSAKRIRHKAAMLI